MRYLKIEPGDVAEVHLNAYQLTEERISLAEGSIESVMESPLGNLYGGTRLYGTVWLTGPNVVIRYYAARPPGWETVPICAEGRQTAVSPLPGVPNAQRGGEVLYWANAVAVVVETFR